MTRSKFVPILRNLLPDLPGFATKGRLLFKAPINEILQGICFEPSGFDPVGFYVTRFVMPLCVPSTYIYFTFGDRIEPRQPAIGWSMDLPNLMEELLFVIKSAALPFLLARDSLTDFVEATPATSYEYNLQGLAYSQARIGRTEESLANIDRLLSNLSFTQAWQHALADQVQSLKTKLIDNPAAAQDQLMAWEAETIEGLRLTKFWKGQ